MSDGPDSTAPSPADDDAPVEKKTMGIDRYERNWIILSIVLLVAFFSTVTVAGLALGFALPGEDQEVDPRIVADSEPWSNPGLREISPGVFDAYVMSQAWSFTPRVMEVPVGSEVTLYVTSKDLQHGFKITDTNINMQVVPGQVSKLSFTFDDLGEFPYLCTEYCGQGHAAMFGQVNVVPREEYEANKAAAEATEVEEPASGDPASDEAATTQEADDNEGQK